MTNRHPFTQTDKLAQDMVGILGQIRANTPDPLPTELAQAANDLRGSIAGKQDFEIKQMMRDTVLKVAQQTGRLYSNDDILAFEKRTKQG
jgi:hypothetical protein